MLRKHEKGIIEAQKGVALDPNGAHNYYVFEHLLLDMQVGLRKLFK